VQEEKGVSNMFRRGNDASSLTDTFIGPHTVLEGSIQTDHSMTVDGRVIGTIKTQGEVVVSGAGRVEAHIHAGSVMVAGRVTGNIVARQRLQITETGRVQGDIEAAAIKVAEGGKVEGVIRMTEESQPDGSDSHQVILLKSIEASHEGGILA
jgi:cytoskeletal protein CcmA (bactofilin family)